MIDISIEVVKLVLVIFVLFLIKISITCKNPINEHMTEDIVNVPVNDDLFSETRTQTNTTQRKNDIATKRKVQKTIFKVFIRQLHDQNKFNKEYMNFEENYFEYLSNDSSREITTDMRKGLFEYLLVLEEINNKAKKNNERCHKIKPAYEHINAPFNVFERGLDECFDVFIPLSTEYINEIYKNLFDMLFETILKPYNVINFDLYESLLNTTVVTDDYEFVHDVNVTELFDLSIFNVTHENHKSFRNTLEQYLVNVVGTQLSIINSILRTRILKKEKCKNDGPSSNECSGSTSSKRKLINITKKTQSQKQNGTIDFSGNTDYTKIMF
jgi:hypothetical protein